MIGKVKLISQDKKGIFIDQLDKQYKGKEQDTVEVNVKHPKRSKQQNSRYWVLLQWVIDELFEASDILKPSSKSVHEQIKAWYELKYGVEDFSTADLDKFDHCIFADRVENEVFIGQLHVDTSPFNSAYEAFKIWQEGTGGTFKEFIQS